MQNDIFQSYCEQHAKVLEWFKCHQNYPLMLPHEIYHSHQYKGKVSCRSDRKVQNGKRTNGRSKKSRSNNDEYKQNQHKNDDDFEFMVPDEMADFFLITAQHKKEREERKLMQQEAEAGDGSEECDTEEMSSGLFSQVMKPGEKRIKEMQELYGEGAQKIFAMETAMQLTFQRSYDQKAPQPWPTIPLNMKFN